MESLTNFMKMQNKTSDSQTSPLSALIVSPPSSQPPFLQIDYFIGILFLTNMNCYCKSNKLSIHGYYIASVLMNLFAKIRLNNVHFPDIIQFYDGVAQNIDYLNRRVNNENIKNAINCGFSKYIIEISKNLTAITNYSPEKENNIKTDIGLLNNFFYILLLTAKFIGTGLTEEIEIAQNRIAFPNLYKIGEYYANIFIVYLILLADENIVNTEKQLLFNTYVDYKSKLKYSLNEMSLISATTDEIMFYIDHFLMDKFDK
jgi:hypothetical protein